MTSYTTLLIPLLSAWKDVSPPLHDFFAILMSPSLCTLQDMSPLRSLTLFRSLNDLLALCATGHECTSLDSIVSPISHLLHTPPSSTNNAMLPLTIFAATSPAELTTTDSCKINA